MTPEARKFRAADAKALLENPMLKEAFEGVGKYLEAQALSCDPDNKDKAARIIAAKQILVGVRREIERIIEDGTVADMQIAELNKRKGLMRRLIR